jgi:hypothetical protein
VQSAAETAYPKASVTEEPHRMARKAAHPHGCDRAGTAFGAARYGSN